jgi:hypothetical protein
LPNASGSSASVSPEFLQQRLGVFQVGGVETLGEPAVDFREYRARLVTTSPIVEQPREAGSAPSFGRLLAVELWLSLVFGSYNGAMRVFLTEIMPPEVRASGVSLAISLATIFGGFTRPSVPT